MFDVFLSKPVLVGLHLGFAILAIDAFFWLLGEYAAKERHHTRMLIAAVLGFIGFIAAWLIGGYYYVVYYGPLVKPIIKAGAAPWAHSIAMEVKEHIFLFLLPIALTLIFLTLAKSIRFKGSIMWLIGLVIVMGLSIGGMGYVISAAARWGGFN